MIWLEGEPDNQRHLVLVLIEPDGQTRNVAMPVEALEHRDSEGFERYCKPSLWALSDWIRLCGKTQKAS